MASSITFPISAVIALDATYSHLAVFGTKNIFSAMYSSRSSSNPSPSSNSWLYFCSNESDMYLRNISPSTTFLYSAASMLPLNLSAAWKISFSNPRLAPVMLSM